MAGVCIPFGSFQYDYRLLIFNCIRLLLLERKGPMEPTYIVSANVNAFPLPLLAAPSETNLVSRGVFQEFDAISLLTSQTMLALRPPSLESILNIILNAY